MFILYWRADAGGKERLQDAEAIITDVLLTMEEQYEAVPLDDLMMSEAELSQFPEKWAPKVMLQCSWLADACKQERCLPAREMLLRFMSPSPKYTSKLVSRPETSLRLVHHTVQQRFSPEKLSFRRRHLSCTSFPDISTEQPLLLSVSHP